MKTTARRDEKHLSFGIWYGISYLICIQFYCAMFLYCLCLDSCLNRVIGLLILFRGAYLDVHIISSVSEVILNDMGKYDCTKPQQRTTLQWRHNEHDGASNHQPHDCLLNSLFRCRSKKTSKLCVTGLCAGNSPVTSEFPTQRVSNVENVSIWWCHHEMWAYCLGYTLTEIEIYQNQKTVIIPLPMHWSY